MALDTTKAPTNCTSVSVDPGVNELIIKFNITAQSQSSSAENCYVEVQCYIHQCLSHIYKRVHVRNNYFIEHIKTLKHVQP